MSNQPLLDLKSFTSLAQRFSKRGMVSSSYSGPIIIGKGGGSNIANTRVCCKLVFNNCSSRITGTDFEYGRVV